MKKLIGFILIATLFVTAGCNPKPPKPGTTIDNVCGIVINNVSSHSVCVSLMIESPVTGTVTIHDYIWCDALQIVRDVPAGNLGWAEGVPKGNILRVHLHSLDELYGGGQGGKSPSRTTIIK